MKKKKLPIGVSDFKRIIEENYYFSDKSLLIKDVIENDDIIVLPRPRRFGKTLNLYMLKYFFSSDENNTHLFKDLAISKDACIMEHCGKYPTIFLSLKDVKNSNYNDAYAKITTLISSEFRRFKFVFDKIGLDEEEILVIDKILKGKASKTEYEDSLKNLSEYLFRYFNKKTVVLIDEYDMPINFSYDQGYYNDLIGFMRNLLSGCFKDNIYLEKGVLTGILRVAKESIFSGLNNLGVYSLKDKKFNNKFGFTEIETEEIIKYYGLEYELDDVRDWYNGYNFGSLTIYNPWSILEFISKDGVLSPYWINTSGNELIREMIGKSDASVKQDVEKLLNGESVRKKITDAIDFRDLNASDDIIWSFLLMSGYLKYANEKRDNDDEELFADLKIPNREVRSFYKESVLKWFVNGNSRYNLSEVLVYLTSGDIYSFGKSFKLFCIGAFSYFDVTEKQSEKFYHAFVLGMLVSLQNDYSIKSNRESGFGRYDVCLIPKKNLERGFIFEFKAVDKDEDEDLKIACTKALEQIENKKYALDLIQMGIKDIFKIAIAFDGKDSLVSYVKV